MRSVAGTLRLELAQFRELEAFSQFGSDLDEATQARLRRGERLVEILKQPQFSPLSVEKQIIIIFATTNGYLDNVDLKSIAQYEIDLYHHVETEAPDFLNALVDTGNLSDELKETLNKELRTFTEKFIDAQ